MDPFETFRSTAYFHEIGERTLDPPIIFDFHLHGIDPAREERTETERRIAFLGVHHTPFADDA
jgi:hypothetical protein